jgi:hypothetical protein
MDSNKPQDPNAADDVVIDDAEAAAAEIADKPKKSGKTSAPSLDSLTAAVAAVLATPDGMALLAASTAAFFTSSDGIALVADVVSEQLPTPELIELPETKPATAPTFNVDKAASLFGIDPTDIFTCRHYPEEGRYVVVSTDGRKLEMAQVEAAHVA